MEVADPRNVIASMLADLYSGRRREIDAVPPTHGGRRDELPLKVPEQRLRDEHPIRGITVQLPVRTMIRSGHPVKGPCFRLAPTCHRRLGSY